jgi:hypothetical protein
VKRICGCRFPDREIEEPWSSSGRGRRSCERDVPEGAAASSGIRARNISLLSVAEKKRIHHAAEERKTVT